MPWAVRIASKTVGKSVALALIFPLDDWFWVWTLCRPAEIESKLEVIDEVISSVVD